MIRSQAPQRTTPWTAGIGHSSTMRTRKVLCSSSSFARHAQRRDVDPTVQSLLIEADYLMTAANDLAVRRALESAGNSSTVTAVAPVYASGNTSGRSLLSDRCHVISHHCANADRALRCRLRKQSPHYLGVAFNRQQ